MSERDTLVEDTPDVSQKVRLVNVVCPYSYVSTVLDTVQSLRLLVHGHDGGRVYGGLPLLGLPTHHDYRDYRVGSKF